ncbi:MAG: transglutaminase domain-containing protein, partial [Alphaproteobacteria bacterium]|nr:transglutaminase domain-containing protein [Alphaproteobacteria bacterium]
MPSEPHVLFLAPSEFVDSDHPDIKAFVKAKGGGERDPIALALKLFYAVRDGVLYDPYSVRLDRDHYKASSCLKAGRGYCVVKGCLMTAVARAAGIPARLGFADVRNHLATERLKRIMGHDLFTYHGFTELWLDGKWVK